MKIDVVSLFPKMFESVFEESMIGRAVKNKILELDIHNLRDWAIDDYGTVDDKPFGGGAGMLIRADVVYEAINGVKAQNLKFKFPNKTKKKKGNTKLRRDPSRADRSTHLRATARVAPTKTGNDRPVIKVVVLSAKGERYTQKKAEELSRLDNLILLCGHYEGFDQRVMDYMVDEVISIGDYVLTGGEIPAMILIDSVTRLLPDVLGKEESKEIDSFSEVKIKGKKVRKVEYPQYTRPREFMGYEVPEILLSGDHERIKKWREAKTRCR
ncbi:tRNA (guanosine(37)-N1)-methyltransferase TrmD [Patescibacteria group bacterium]|nr:tRNA (guanosine(37)-N1)-methyltransferase TrmD [Patescibacteria group bacterium]MCG2702658.1 tRNA (guanosine(37)-N1)-methyltransferase TrmD [Candidatus Parcubacteria bacterium]MBU4264867.1 tRNA (guanosine(37)-N1)-methyltransferase TrmD [Patescibacteria group bacterium]MBU4389738.1 tRNA (guanosine(37)-N1)-methyltransferase TrmD [Patescibacteria group bacterium]MBU4397432.1 tRNA (guanosine(37)-N1)-methyltransferase TrmD [Patescibacteria group bacterium]